MADMFNISVSSLQLTYSADFGNINPYKRLVGNFTSDGNVNTFKPLITGPVAPYTEIKLSPITANTFWAGNIDLLRFYWIDLYDPNPLYDQITKSSFIAAGGHINHIYGPPGEYFMGMLSRNAATSAWSQFYIGHFQVGEILPRPQMSLFDINGDTIVPGVSANSPYTINFSATATVAGSYPIESLTWDFGDRTSPPRVITRFEGEYNILNYRAEDPRDTLASHTYYRNDSVPTPRGSLHATLEVESMVTTSTSAVSSAELNALDYALPETRRLIKGRLFGQENKFLLISETDEGQVYQHLILSLSGIRPPAFRT
jgi:hypothetical protein